MFGGDGLVNRTLADLGIQVPNWVADPDYSLYTLVLLGVWQFGSPAVIFLAGLRQIPGELTEAATVDGASRVRRFVSITLPLLTPLIFFNLVFQTIVAFQAFTPAFVVSNGAGGPVDSTPFYTLYLYIQGFGEFRMGYASGWRGCCCPSPGRSPRSPSGRQGSGCSTRIGGADTCLPTRLLDGIATTGLKG